MTDRSPDSGASAPDGGRAGAPTRTRRNLTILGVLVVALALLVAGAWQLVIPMLRGADDAVTDYPGPVSGEVSGVISDPTAPAAGTTRAEAGVLAAGHA